MTDPSHGEQGAAQLKNAIDSRIEGKPFRPASLVQAVTDLLEGRAPPSILPRGMAKIERATIEAVRIRFDDKIDKELLSRQAEEEGYSVEEGRFPPRVIKEGMIVARVGSKSDAGGPFDLYVYLFPPEMEKISIYRRVLAEREGILDRSTGRINAEKFYDFNLKVIRLVSRYAKEKYGS